MDLEFTGDIFYWRGPAPYHFVAVPEAQSSEIKSVSRLVTYGWGVIPVTVRVGRTVWKTSLFPKQGRYLVPLKDSVRAAERLSEGDTIAVSLSLGLR